MEETIYCQKMAKTVALITDHPDISQANKDIVQRFANEYQSVRGVTDATIWGCVESLKLLLIDHQMNLPALLRGGDDGFNEAERINLIINQRWHEKWNTRDKKIRSIKTVCKFLDYNDDGELRRRRSKRGAECLDFISPGKQVTTSKTRKNTLLIADIQKIDEAIAGSPLVEARTRAHLWLSLDLGFRAGECEGILIEDIIWDTINGEGRVPVKVDVFGKKNKWSEREELALTVISQSHLARWLRLHPDSDNPKALLFCPLRGNTEKWGSCKGATKLATFLKDAAKRAGITDAKRVHQTGFRSAMQTYWISQGVDPAEIRKRVGHSPTSTMMEQAYRAIDIDSSNEAFLRATGEIPEAQQIQYTPPDHCPVCKAPIHGLSTYCHACDARFTFDMTEVERIEEAKKAILASLMDYLYENAEAREKLLHIEELMGQSIEAKRLH